MTDGGHGSWRKDSPRPFWQVYRDYDYELSASIVDRRIEN